MGVWINSTGDNQLPTRIKESVWSSRDEVKVSPNERHGLAVNQDVGGIRVDGRDDMPPLISVFTAANYTTPRYRSKRTSGCEPVGRTMTLLI